MFTDEDIIEELGILTVGFREALPKTGYTFFNTGPTEQARKNVNQKAYYARNKRDPAFVETDLRQKAESYARRYRARQEAIFADPVKLAAYRERTRAATKKHKAKMKAARAAARAARESTP
jgi:hypothetical protein